MRLCEPNQYRHRLRSETGGQTHWVHGFTTVAPEAGHAERPLFYRGTRARVILRAVVVIVQPSPGKARWPTLPQGRLSYRTQIAARAVTKCCDTADHALRYRTPALIQSFRRAVCGAHTASVCVVATTRRMDGGQSPSRVSTQHRSRDSCQQQLATEASGPAGNAAHRACRKLRPGDGPTSPDPLVGVPDRVDPMT